jgi:lipopolysaccharide/colanic/teichoic acid biosynthesis glycosyltransferase
MTAVAAHPSSAFEPPRPATADAPSLWGLSARDLHDACWRARGVQCVRQGELIALDRAAEFYLLIHPGQFVLFDIGALSERLLWRNARLTRLRVADSNLEEYSERLALDAAGNVRAVTRRYRPTTRVAHRVVLTRSRRFASMWMRASDPRTAWQRLRANVAWASIDHWRCEGRCFDEHDHSQAASCITRIVEQWDRPDQAIDGIESRGDGVWTLAGDHADASAVLIGPVWAGRGALNDCDDCLIGPMWVGDRGTGAVERPAIVRPINQVELADRRMPPGAKRPRGWPNSDLKRAIDLVGAMIGLVVFALLLPLLALAVWLEDGRPIFYHQRRQTRGGDYFKCWKIRSMYRNADEIRRQLMAQNQADGPQFYMEYDPRVTRIGRILRTTHLDELPQLWNVARGQMSLVGPRPSPDDENQYCPAWRELRLSVRPGITGLWQLKRTREQGTDFQEWIRYDIEYVRTASLWLDIKIVVMTIVSILRRRRDHAPE